ncbi:MAG TPA: ATP-binding protein [Candidatus Acidoferrum sp.]|nr:ATP-binding protein [Candidatus Acidoferrum sp.]
MNNGLSNLARQYSSALRRFSRREHEALLAQAYGLGRSAIARGFGVLDMARVHQASLGKLLKRTAPAKASSKALCTAEDFFLETLAPFEATLRGFRETNSKLQRAINALEKRNAELAVMNEKLMEQVRERRKTEHALRDSEEHFRTLFERACAMQQNLRELSHLVFHAQEEERKRISRELHDETSQALTAISITLASLDASSRNGVLRRKRIHEAQRLLQETMGSLHDFARELRPTSLDELGLLPAVRSWLKNFARRTGLRVCFRATKAAEDLDENQKTTLYRVMQESLTNVAKHAKATRVEFVLRKLPDRICLTISDNGKSFRLPDGPPVRGQQRLGLLGMQERVRLINGQLTILPRPGKGTTLHLAIPLSVNGSAEGRYYDARVGWNLRGDPSAEASASAQDHRAPATRIRSPRLEIRNNTK